MVKLLIADDEPLVCVGLRSMLKWEELGIEVIGTARNGRQAAELIEKQRPEIVITDINMPLLSGLELAEECARKYGKIPLFIILTSFEEYQFVRRAIAFQAVDYLVKLELSPESLSASVLKALSMLELLRGGKSPNGGSVSGNRDSIQSLREKFFIRLCNNLFESREQYLSEKEALGLDFSFPAYVVLLGEIESAARTIPDDKILSLYSSSVEMVREMLEKNRPCCYVTILDIRHFTVVFCLQSAAPAEWRNNMEGELRKIISIVHDYFNVRIRMAAGKPVEDPLRLDESYLSAKRVFRETSGEAPLSFFEEPPEQESGEFIFKTIRPDMRRAFEDLDPAAFRELVSGINAHFRNRPDLLLEAMDAVCSVLYMAVSLLPGGDEIIPEIFRGENEGFRSIYRMNSTEAVLDWLDRLVEGCCAFLSSQRQNYKHQIVANVQEYIRKNLDKRLSLPEVAAVYNISPNYLSRLFTQYAGTGFVEYITAERIHAAREMLARGEGPVYEIAEKLGFENAFYFSKVFKKVEGVSPREYLRKIGKAPD